MIKIENTESDIFESAYFIIRQNAELPKKCRSGDILREAVRLVDEKLSGKASRKMSSLTKEKIIFFVSGAAMAAVIFALICLLN